MWTSLPVTSTELRGGATTATISVSWKRPLRTALGSPRLAIHHCGDPVRIPNNWADVCGFLKLQGSDRYWNVRLRGAFSIPRKAQGLRPTDQCCHHETWLHLDFVDWRNTRSHHEEPDRRILLKERPMACPYGQQRRRISEVMSDKSLSS